MKIKLYLVFLVLTCISCKNRNQYELEFENHLPETDLILLQKIVNTYDELIKTKYNGDTDKFLTHIESNKSILENINYEEYCELVKMFDDSTLEYKSKNVKYDSVYISDQGYITTVVQPEDITENGLHLDEEILIPTSNRTNEEEIEEIKRRGYWRFISASSFLAALSNMSKKTIDVEDYIDAKEFWTHTDTQKMAWSIRKNKMDVNNYFNKRIIVLEIFINQIRKENEC